jgi:outer membrane lipoprotein-sorting protein
LALGIASAMMLAGSASTVALGSDASGDTLSPGEIFKKAQEKYASLTSYSDEGKAVATINGMTITTAFNIRLARPNLYRIEWDQNNDSTSAETQTQKQAVWSAGDGDYLDYLGIGAQKQATQELALGAATGISGGAAATVPGTFFKLNWGNQLGGSVSNKVQQADEKVGDVDCYVFKGELKGTTNTIWIGKQDFLIHQVRNITSAKAMKAELADAAKRNPGIATSDQQFSSITSTETHTKIVVNHKYSPTDFAR